jgi:hypothetical protein
MVFHSETPLHPSQFLRFLSPGLADEVAFATSVIATAVVRGVPAHIPVKTATIILWLLRTEAPRLADGHR